MCPRPSLPAVFSRFSLALFSGQLEIHFDANFFQLDLSHHDVAFNPGAGSITSITIVKLE